MLKALKARVSRTDILTVAIDIFINAIGYLGGGPLFGKILLLASLLGLWLWFRWDDRPGAPKPPRVSVEIVRTALLPTQNIGKAVDDNYREPYCAFFLLRCTSGWDGNLALMKARLSLGAVDQKRLRIEATDALAHFSLKQDFVRSEPIFGIRDDYRWEDMQPLLGKRIEKGNYAEGWVQFCVPKISRSDFEMNHYEIAIQDALGFWHALAGSGLRSDAEVYSKRMIRPR